MALAALTASDASARAAADCVAAPKGSVPQGSHWYYRWDREGQRKCWYVAAWKGTRTADTARVKTASAWPPVSQVSAQPRVSDSSPTTLRDEAAQQSDENRIRRLLYGTEQAMEGVAPPHTESRRSLTPLQTAVADEGGRPTSAASSLPSTRDRAVDEVVSDTFVAVPSIVEAQTKSASSPGQTALYLVAMLAIAGGLLHVGVKLTRTRRQQIRRRNAYMLAPPRHTPRALPPDRVRRFA